MDFETAREFVTHKVSIKIKDNPALSMRSLSSKIGIAASTLSEYLSGKHEISQKNFFKIIDWLEIKDETKLSLLILLFKCESIPNNDLRVKVLKQIHGLKNRRFEIENISTKRIETFLKKSRIIKTYRYATKNDVFNCRVLNICQTDINEIKQLAFYDVFISSTEKAACTGYFIPNIDNTYDALLDSSFDGSIKPSPLIDKKNKNLIVSFDENSFPTLRNSAVALLGTDRYVETSLFSYSLKCMTISGNVKSLNDPNFLEPITCTWDHF